MLYYRVYRHSRHCPNDYAVIVYIAELAVRCIDHQLVILKRNYNRKHIAYFKQNGKYRYIKEKVDLAISINAVSAYKKIENVVSTYKK